MATETQSHLDNFEIQINLDLLPQLGLVLDFSKILVINVLTGNDLTGSPETYQSSALTGTGLGGTSLYATISENDTVIDTDMDAAGRACLDRIFNAKIHPQTVQVVSIADADNLTDIANALKDSGKVFYSVVVAGLKSGVGPADVVTAFNQSGMTHTVFAGATSGQALLDASTFASTDIGSLSAALKRRLYCTYHDGNGTTEADFAEIAALYAATDWDNMAAGGNLVLTRTGALGTITGTQKSQLDANNVNHALPCFGTSTYVDEGVVISGSPIYHVFTEDWLENRLRNAVAKVKTNLANRRRKLPMDSTGQALVLSEIRAVMQQAIRAQHTLSSDEAEVRSLTLPFERAESITTQDITDRKLRFTVLAYFLEDARVFKVEVNLKS